MFPTPAQFKLIRDLCTRLGYDPDDYLTPRLTKAQASDIIAEMLEELRG